MRTCSRCGQEKPLEHFLRNTRAKSPDGHYSICRVCQNKARYGGRSSRIERKLLNVELAKEGLKQCSRCSETKPFSEFVTWHGGHGAYCKECAKHRKRLIHYGLSTEDYARMVLEQNGLCAVCGLPPAPGKELHVDHDHKTGRVRKLLCFHCNTALGHLNEDLYRVLSLARYIETQVLYGVAGSGG